MHRSPLQCNAVQLLYNPQRVARRARGQRTPRRQPPLRGQGLPDALQHSGQTVQLAWDELAAQHVGRSDGDACNVGKYPGPVRRSRKALRELPRDAAKAAPAGADQGDHRERRNAVAGDLEATWECCHAAPHTRMETRSESASLVCCPSGEPMGMPLVHAGDVGGKPYDRNIIGQEDGSEAPGRCVREDTHLLTIIRTSASAS